MHFIHSTILPQSKIENCTVLDVRQREVDVLLYYHRCIKIATLYKKGTDISFKAHQTIYIETPLLWGTVINSHGSNNHSNNYFVSITQDNQLIITEIGTSLKQISSIDLFTSVDENTEKFKYFSVSKDKNWILIASESDHFFFIDIKDIQNPLLGARKIENLQIKSVTSLSSDDSFLILARNDTEQKFVKFTAKKQDISIEDADLDVQYFIDTESPGKASHFNVTNKAITNGNSPILPLTEPIQAFTKVVNDCCAVQLKSGNLYFLSNSQATFIPGAPLIKSMWLLPNESVITNLDDGTSMVFTVQKPSNARKKVSNWASVPQIPLEGTILNNKILPFNGELLGLGKNGVTVISDRADRAQASPAKTIGVKKLLQVDSGCLAVTGSGKTEVVYGEADIDTAHEALAFINFRKSIYLVHEKGLSQENGEDVVTFEEPIRAVAATGFRIVVVSGQNTISILNESFKREDKVLSGEVTAVAVSMHYFAVYSYDNDPLVMNGAISLYDFSFEKVCQDIKFPSIITSLSFGHAFTELFCASQNGAIYKLPVLPTGFTNGVSLLYAGKTAAHLTPFIGDDRYNLVTFDDETSLLLVDDNLYDIGLSGFDTISLVMAEDEKLAIAVIENGDMTVIPYDTDITKQFKLIENTKDVCDGFSSKEKTVLLHKLQNQLKVTVLSSDKPSLSSEPISIEEGSEAKSVICESDAILIVFNNQIKYLNIKGDVIKVISFIMFSEEVICCSMNQKGDSFVVADKNRLTNYKIKEGKITMSRGFCQLSSKPSTMTWSGELIWVSFDDGSVFVFVYNDVAERFEIISKSDGVKNVTSLCTLDDITMAFGCMTGEIYVLRVNESRALGLCQKSDMTKLANITIDTPVISLCVINKVLFYLTTGGFIGAFSPYFSTTDFMVMQQMQLLSRKYISSKFGFCVLNRKSLSSQYSVTDITLFETIGKQATLDKEMLDNLVYVNALLGREKCRFMF
ncbi:hypothetical protein TVAG_456790 [Trichomonas vaginalis G3]|uniref:DNA damage-binding protein 1 n=1 Tax=Trichomonas vaginalis (strain ATCC PRA-98 / G3) TaxID=412133 RepID=A2DC03_TRIV3|nr:hypothetical protein TVAG_456790 [Trichomonas vaginalis G3]|eukprot:XP_001583030.1 hypothetical protein [Trichomonas vaginalis G3]